MVVPHQEVVNVCGTAYKDNLLLNVFKLADERMYQEKKKKGRK